MICCPHILTSHVHKNYLRGQHIQGNITKKGRLPKKRLGWGGAYSHNTLQHSLVIYLKADAKLHHFSFSMENITSQLLKLDLMRFSHFSSTGEFRLQGQGFHPQRATPRTIKSVGERTPEKRRPSAPPN